MKPILMIWCHLFLLIVSSGATTAQGFNQLLETAKKAGEQDDTLELARRICWKDQLEIARDAEKSLEVIQLLAAKLDSVPVHERTTLLRAIQKSIPLAAATAYFEVEKRHAEKAITDGDWVTTLCSAVELVPEQLEESLLKSLEEWNKRIPYKASKMPIPHMFHSRLLSLRGPNFLIRAAQSTDARIAEDACRSWCEKQSEQLESMRDTCLLLLDFHNSTHRLEAMDFYSRINSTWKGQLVRLQHLTRDSNSDVAAKATELWTRGDNPARLKLEMLATGTAAQRVATLESLDKTTIEEWGTLYRVVELFNSPDVGTRIAAVRAFGRLSDSIAPVINAFQTEAEAVVRQAILDETPFREWNEIFSLLAKAERAGLNTEKAMRRISAPYGFRPNHIYRQLNQGMPGPETLRSLGVLLECDPSEEATQMAIQVLEKQLKARGKDGRVFSMQYTFTKDFYSMHAKRLSAIVPELADNIESTKSRLGVKLLAFFGDHAEPALPLMIRILEDDSGEWRNCREAAIHAIRAMGTKGKLAEKALLKVIADPNSYRREAAMAYLSIGCDPAPLFPAMGGSLPVLAKIDPEKLVKIPGFQEYIRSEISTKQPYDILMWLGPHAEFLMPELKHKFRQVFPTPNSYQGELKSLLNLIAEFGPVRQEFVPLCLEHLNQEPIVPHVCLAAIETLNRTGDEQRLAYESIKVLTHSKENGVRIAAQKCLQSLYGE